MFVGPQLHIHAVLVEEWLQAKEIQHGQSLSHNGLVIGAVISVVIAAVHWSMAIGDDPRTLPAVLGFVCLDQIPLQPVVLHDDLLDPELGEVVDLRAETDKVHRSQVKAVEHVL